MILDLIYPPVCGICNKINRKHLCRKWEIKLKQYEIYAIVKEENRYFDYRIDILKYENIVRKCIIDYKFNEKAYKHKMFEKILLKNEKIYSFLKKYDIITYVPMFKNKKAKRGYNQTEIIAKDISKKLRIKLEKNNIIKIKDTKKQSTLNKKEREKNVKDAFAIRNTKNIVSKKVILFDDIYTTGNTVNECSKILKEAGAEEIVVLTIAKD